MGGDVGAGYRVVRNKKLEFDLLLGLKFIYFSARLESDFAGIQPISAELDNLWVDPVVATNFIYRPHERFELVALGDVGATLLNPDLTYQFSMHANVLITRRIYLSGGYRNYYVKMPKKEAVFTGTIHGMIVKFGVQF